MLLRWMLRVPWLLPCFMVAFNATRLVMGILWEGRIRQGSLKYMFGYASTVPAAVRGDLGPFFLMLSGPLGD